MIRDWRQTWNPKNEFIFIQALKGMLDGDVRPGDPVTPEMRKHLGLAALLAFWKAGAIAIAPKTQLPSEQKQVEAPVTPAPSAAAVTETPSSPLPKKRGRPSKADLAAREAAKNAAI